MGASGQKSKSQSGSASSDSVFFPGNFLGAYGEQYGQMPSITQLMQMMPQSGGLWGGGVGWQPTGGGQGQVGGDALGMARTTTGGGGQGAQAPTGSGGGWPSQSQGPLRFTVGDVSSAIDQSVPQMGRADRKAMGVFLEGLRKLDQGQGASAGYTLDELETKLRGSGLKGADQYIPQVMGVLAERQQLADQRNAPPPGTVAGAQNPLAGLANQGVSNLGFGQRAEEADIERVLGFVPKAGQITGPNIQAASVQVPGGDYDKYQQAVYRSLYDPQRREIERLGADQDRGLQALLGQAGMASSGSGIGQLANQQRERGERLLTASSEAASRAMAERYGKQFETAINNAKFQQESALEQARLDQNAQISNADSILRTGQAQQSAYLSAIGLNPQIASQARGDFLSLLGLGEQDLARQDQFSQNAMSQMMDAFLKHLGLTIQAGSSRNAQSKATSSSSGGGAQLS